MASLRFSVFDRTSQTESGRSDAMRIDEAFGAVLTPVDDEPMQMLITPTKDDLQGSV
jgi:hypothetical protein